MTNISTAISDLPPEQRAIRDKCFHPTGRFIQFKREEIEQSIPDRFEQMVRMYPDRLAVMTKNHTLTYDELNRASNRVAHAIIDQRGERNEPVAILLEHGAPVIVAILGVLKAGKIYVILDPSYPHARIDYILKDTRAVVIVTDERNLLLAKTFAPHGCQVLSINSVGARAKNTGLALSPHMLAYITYTSGSTGEPKGVVQNHRSVLHDIMRLTNSYHICVDDRLSLFTSFSFGESVPHLFGALLKGAALFPLDLKKEGVETLINLLIEEEITIYHSIPELFQRVTYALTGEERFSKLRLLHLSGAPAKKKDVELYKKYFPRECIFAHRLGGAEFGDIRWFFINKDTSITSNIVPVGYAVEDVEILLLDDDGHEVGFNYVGEIAIKSQYLSPGYWRRSDLTEAKFLPDPKGGDDRIYLSGDLGRMSEDGCLEHLGRKDFQVKVRGFRIETGEVEMRMSDHTAIKEVAVVAQRYQSGDKRLVAYFVPSSKTGPSISELRAFLKTKLPDYMIPSAFVVLDVLPLTPTGKVDRQALPAPGRARPELETPFAPPRTPAEQALVQIWTEVLSVDQVGIHDNFLELGGHSLAATQIISRVINTFKVELPIKSFFELPTVADMAVVITENMSNKVGHEELARMLAELESLSDQEARKRLAVEESKGHSEK